MSLTLATDCSKNTMTVADLDLAEYQPKPTCRAVFRGFFGVKINGAGVKDSSEIRLKAAGDTYAWETI